MIRNEVAKRTRAAVFLGAGTPLELREFPHPELAPGEVFVRVTCCTLCGSDFHTYLGRRSTPLPTILGHEVVGEIADLGPGKAACDFNGEPLQIGDRISWSVAASCGKCFFCNNGLPQKCEGLFKYGHESCCNGHPLSGGLAEHCHLQSGTSILRVPPQIPDVVAAPANCVTATATAALRTAGDLRNRSLLVQGAGLLGLTTMAMASLQGASTIIACDVDSSRLQAARSFGATDLVHLGDDVDLLSRVVKHVTEGRGVDIAFEMAGASAAVEQGLPLLRVGGRYVLVGAVSPIRRVGIDVDQLVRRMLRLEGVHNYAPQDLATAIAFLADHYERFPFQGLVTAEFPLESVEAAFQNAIRTGAVRTAIRMKPYATRAETALKGRRPFSRPKSLGTDARQEASVSRDDVREDS